MDDQEEKIQAVLKTKEGQQACKDAIDLYDFAKDFVEKRKNEKEKKEK